MQVGGRCGLSLPPNKPSSGEAVRAVLGSVSQRPGYPTGRGGPTRINPPRRLVRPSPPGRRAFGNGAPNRPTFANSRNRPKAPSPCRGRRRPSPRRCRQNPSPPSWMLRLRIMVLRIR